MLLFLKSFFIKIFYYIFIIISLVTISCTGSKKYFKAAEKLEKQGLVNEAAQYYYESLERKKSNTDARIKLKEVGQKHVNNLASSFFREFNTQQYEQSIETFDEMNKFSSKSKVLNVDLNYPQAYKEDYNKALEYYLTKNHSEAKDLVNQGKYDLALKNISKIKKYDSNYKNTNDLEIISNCEPLYLMAIRNLESQNYKSAQNELSKINTISATYKDSKELLDLTTELQKKSFMIFEPKNSTEKAIEDKLFNSFIELSYQNNSRVKLINNTPFLFMPNANDITNAGNIDLIQAIKKATGADFFYVFDISNKKEIETPATRGTAICFEKIVTRRDTIFITEYRPQQYNQVKGKRNYEYEFKYKLIDANTNQVVTSRSELCNGVDEIDYYEFVRGRKTGNQPDFNMNVSNYFPYNPGITMPVNQYNPNNWRGAFNNRKELKSFSDLKNLADNKALNVFSNTLINYIVQ
jgi:hypothetical protein